MSGSNEFFVRDEGGNKTDASLHDDILDNKTADLATRKESFVAVIQEDGADVETAKAMYGLSDKDIKGLL